MAIELSTITFTDQDDIVPASGVEQILNTGLTNTLAGNDRIAGFGDDYGFKNVGELNTDDGNDTITGTVPSYPEVSNFGIDNSGTLNTGEGDDVITGINVAGIGIINSGTLNTAEGNDIITANAVYGRGIDNIGTLNTGEGNDTIRVEARFAMRISGTLNTEEGDDVISVSGRNSGIIISGTLNTAEGDDVITSGGMNGGMIIRGIFDTGDGNDRIGGFSGDNGIYNDSFTFNTGDGNDTIEGIGIYGIYNKGLINTGNGKDIIITQTSRRDDGNGLENFSTIYTGDDDDIIKGENRINNNGYIHTGDGDDSIIASTATPDLAALINLTGIETGEGNDIITSTGSSGNIHNIQGDINGRSISNDGTINTGNGQDSIISQGNFTNRGNVFLEDGNDLLTASLIGDTGFPNRAIENFNFIGTGDGNDIITSTGVIYNEGIINTGDGDDSIIVNRGVDGTGAGYGIYNNGGAIITGNGNDSIIANEGFESAPNSSGAWFLGEGEDYIKGYGSGDFYGGNGNDILELTPGSYTVGRWADNTGESVVFTKGNSLMITSEFEQLIAGGTTYNFTSLTAGQIIVIA